MVEVVGDRVGPAELVRLAAVARRFYVDGRSKLELAEEFGVSRFKIARLLDQPDLRTRLGEQGRRTILQTFQLEPNVRAFASTLWPEWFAKEEAVASV